MKMVVDILVIGGMIGLIVMIVSGYHRKKIEQMKEREERENKRG